MSAQEPAPDTTRVPILVADDDAITRSLLRKMLTASGYEVLTACNGREAIDILKARRLHLVVAESAMSEISGLELCRWIRAQSAGRDVFILMLMSTDDESRLTEALDAGADEFIRRPIRVAEVRARLGCVQRRLGLISRDATIFALAQLADSRDPEIGDHLERIRGFARILAEELAAAGEASAELPDLVYLTSPMHDIGKAGIPDDILLKPGQLSSSEFEIMKVHTTIGAGALDRALAQNPAMEYLRTARDIALTHHERFDGTGYPDGLKGDAIPLAGRIVALCDVYDTITSKRVYKSAKPHNVARAEIVRSAGSQFDPRIVEAFLRSEPLFLGLSAEAGEHA